MEALVLVASADDSVRRLCRRDLAKTGCDILLARSGWEARRLASLAHPDLVIVDMRVVWPDPVTLIESLRAQDVPSIILLADPTRDAIPELVPLADARVTRSQDVRALAEAIEGLLAHRDQSRAAPEIRREPTGERGDTGNQVACGRPSGLNAPK